MKTLSKEASRLALIELPATLFGQINGDMGYDIYTKFGLPPRATPTLTGIAKRDSWKNVRQISPVYHGRNGIFDWEKYIQEEKPDFVGISAITRTLNQSFELGDIIKRLSPKTHVWFGGMGPSYLIEESLKHGNGIVRGEGEATFMELLNRLSEDSCELEGIEGIAYNKNGNIVVNPDRKRMATEKYGSLSFPVYDKEIIDGISVWALEQERGCPFGCNYCNVTQTYGKTLRNKRPERVIEEMRYLKKLKKNAPIFFTGDNFTGNLVKGLELAQAINDSGMNGRYNSAQVSIHAAKKPELLIEMKKAGIDALCVGFESLNDESLRDLNKSATAEQNTEAIKTFHNYGFWVHAMMMIGTDSDTPESVRYSLEWTKKYADSAQFSIPIPLPGTPFYDDMDKKGRILTKDWYLYDGLHCVIQPKNFTPYQLQKELIHFYRDFYSPKESVKRMIRSPMKMFNLGILGYTFFQRGVDKSINNPQAKKHIEFLKNLD